MSKKTDSNSYTMMFAIGMVLVVGSLLAYLASSLKPNIDIPCWIRIQKIYQTTISY